MVGNAVGVLLTPVLWAVRHDGSYGRFVEHGKVELDSLIFGPIGRLFGIVDRVHGSAMVHELINTAIKICVGVFAGALVSDPVVVDNLDRSLLVHAVFIHIERVVDRSTGACDGLVVNAGLELLDGLAAVVASSLPVIAAGTRRSRGVQDEVDAGGERTDVGLDVVALGGDGGVKSELHLLNGLAAVVASGLPVIAAGTRRSRGVQDEVDTGGERTDVGLDVVTLGGDGGVKSEFRLLDGLAFVIASSLPVIAARTHGGRGVQNEVDT